MPGPAAATGLGYPPAARLELVEVLHGHPVADPYRWLEEPAAPETVTWQRAQDELFQRERAAWPDREALHARLGELVAVTHLSSPRQFGDRSFYLRLEPGWDHAVLLAVAGNSERVVFNPLAWDPTGATTLEAWQPDWAGELVAIQFSVGGVEDCQLVVLRTDTGQIVDGPIDRVRRSSVAWLPDGRQFYYVRRLDPRLNPGEERYHRRVNLHRLGTPADADPVIFGEGRDRTSFYGVAIHPAASLLVLTASAGAGSGSSQDVWIADVRSDDAHRPVLRPLQVGRGGGARVHLSSHAAGSVLYLQTDGQAGRGRIATVPAADPDFPQHELVPEDPCAVITDFAILDHPELAEPLALISRCRHGMSEMEVLALADGSSRGRVELPGPGVTGNVSVGDGGRTAWFRYSDPARPSVVLRFDAATRTVQRWQPGGARVGEPAPGADVLTRQVTFRSADGTQVRMFVISSAGHPDRPRPAVLTGYGGFGAVMAPSYRPEVRAWVERGGVFAIAGLRGGGEEGAAWHQAGTRLDKQKVFDDFAAAADHLVGEGWTTNGRLGIYGESNGGLLVGAALTQHPEKFAAAVCVAPLLDMVRYEHSGMGPSWRREYGTAADPVEFENLLRYSPYHAVRPRTEYPAVLLCTFEGDSRVDQLHARKMCAALQHVSRKPVLLRSEPGVGHGTRPITSSMNLFADCLAFLAVQLGL